jgi:polysaccharide biosynthesis/export protein
VMRARQAITEATRNLEGLRDKQQTDVATELLHERAYLDQLVLKQEVAQKLLFEELGSGSADLGQVRAVTFAVVRREGGESTELPATDATTLLPGDVVKVKLGASPTEPSVSTSLYSDSISSTDAEGISR